MRTQFIPEDYQHVLPAGAEARLLMKISHRNITGRYLKKIVSLKAGQDHTTMNMF